MNDWRIIYQNNVDYHQQRGEANYLRYAFEDTVATMLINEEMTPLQVKEHLNGLIPMWNTQKERNNA